MINLFSFENYIIDTSRFSNILHDKIVTEFENKFAEYVGAKYACGINSATNAIFLTFQDKAINVKIPSMIPPVVANAVITNNHNLIHFDDNTHWIGHPYILHQFDNYKVIDSAQHVEKNQFKNTANNNDIIIFSFYPTKPISSCDGGMIVSNDKDKIDWYRQAVHNGTTTNINSWERTIKFPGFKMYLNSIQAYIASINLDNYEEKLEKLQCIKEYYNNNLNYNNDSNHLYIIQVNNNKKFIKDMYSNGIQCGIHYPPLHLNSVYNKYNMNNKSLPVTESIMNNIVSIPYHYNLTLKEISYVCKKIELYNRTTR